MDTFGSSFSQSFVLNEQVARQIFEIMPEQGLIMVIMDLDGNCWPSDSQKFSELSISEVLLKDLCEKIDDGDEPIITQVNNYSVVATQLATERTNCGYVLIAIPHCSPESTLINIDLLDLLLDQISLIAKLVEKNNLLYESQMRNPNLYDSTQMSLN